MRRLAFAFVFVCGGVFAETTPAQSWQNPNEPLDVNNDGNIWLDDPLAIVNYLSENPGGPLPAGDPFPYYDLDDDGMATPRDVLQLVHHITKQPIVSVPDDLIEGTEGEASLRLELAQAGDATQTVEAGAPFTLNVYVSGSDRGLFASYADIRFDDEFVNPTPATSHISETFNVAQSEQFEAGLLKQIGGAYGGISNLPPGETLLYSIDFEAAQLGTSSFGIEGKPVVLLEGLDARVPNVTSNTLEFNVVPEPTQMGITLASFLGLLTLSRKRR